MSARRGYILVETLVALAVLSLSILSVHRSISQALLARARTIDFTTARFLFEQKLSELMLQPEVVEGQGRGAFAPPNERFSYVWTISKIEIERPPLPEFIPKERRVYLETGFRKYVGRIELTVQWDRSGQRFERRAQTLIAPDDPPAIALSGPARLWTPPPPKVEGQP